MNHIRAHARLTPLEIFAKLLPQYNVPGSTQHELFSAYADFLNLLDDTDSRSVLQVLRASDSRTDKTFQRVKEISRRFETALDQIFFDNPLIGGVTREYGVF